MSTNTQTNRSPGVILLISAAVGVIITIIVVTFAAELDGAFVPVEQRSRADQYLAFANERSSTSGTDEPAVFASIDCYYDFEQEKQFAKLYVQVLRPQNGHITNVSHGTGDIVPSGQDVIVSVEYRVNNPRMEWQHLTMAVAVPGLEHDCAPANW